MVGVPRSNGCRICIKRRIKCDEARPGCAKCQTYGVSCPGYNKQFKFIERKHHRSQTQCDDEVWPRGEQSIIESPTTSGTSVVLAPGSSVYRVSPTIYSPGTYQIQCLSNFIEDISRSHSNIQDEVAFAHWFAFIPTRLGTNSPLDLAVRCLTVHHLGITEDNEQAISYSRVAYGKALSSVQKALYNPAEATSSRTVSATMILCLYELFACTKADSWMKHAEGVSKLIQLRGPGSYYDSFDSAMLRAFKGLLIMEALFAGKDCFLDREEWHKVTLRSPDDTTSAQFYQRVEEFSRCLAVCPGLVKEAYAISSGRSTQVSALVYRTLHTYDRLKCWFTDFVAFAPPPEEVPSSVQDSLYSVVYRYCNSSTAVTFCGYYATIIIIHKILIGCNHNVGSASIISASLDQICKSVEYLAGTGILGPYRLGFSLRIAFEVAPVTTKIWIRKWLEQFGKFYGATSTQNYPPIEASKETTEL